MNFFRNFLNPQKTPQPQQPASLAIESLEERQMLSTVSEVSTASFFIEGQTGEERYLVLYQGVGIGGGIATGGLQEIQFQLEDEDLFVNDFEIQFQNDAFGEGFDRNLRVDRLEINGEVYRANDPSVFSTGTYLAEDGVVDGFGRGDTLHANGFMRFDISGRSGTSETTLISFNAEAVGQASGFDGANASWELLIGGESVDQGALFFDSFLPSEGTFIYRAQGSVAPEDVEIAFTNDMYLIDAGGNRVDTNLQVNSVTIGDVTFDPRESNVFSTGTYRAEDGLADGFGRGNVLHTNGSFSFTSGSETTTITVDAFAQNSGGAELDVLIDDVVVETLTFEQVIPSRLTQVFTVVVAGDISPDRIKLEFTNDFFDDSGIITIDRNLTFREISIGSSVFDPATSNQIFSTGTYRAEDGITPGFGRGDTLHTNGFFQFFTDQQA